MPRPIRAALASVREVSLDPGSDEVLERPFNDTALMSFSS